MNDLPLDLNLLKVFSALYTHRNVTRAAATIGLAQPSMSNALSRLRSALGDELFVKSRTGMIPTERANLLAPKIAEALDLIAEAVCVPPPFDPATTTATIRIAAPDNIVLNLAPGVSARLAQAAPGMRLRFRAFGKDAVFNELDRGDTDVAVSRFETIPARFYQRDLSSDRFVVIARKDHPIVSAGLSLTAYCKAHHILVSFRADAQGAIDDRLKAVGKRRNIALVLPQFAVVPDIVAQTDYLATLPQSVADALAERSGCICLSLPLDQESWTNQVIWSAQTNADPAKRFAVETLLAGFQAQTS